MYYNIYVRSLLCTTTIYVRSLLCTFVRHFSRSPTIVDSTNCKRTLLCQAFWQMFYKCVFPRQATSISLFANPRKDWFDALDSTAVGEVWMKCLIEFSIHGIIHLLHNTFYINILLKKILVKFYRFCWLIISATSNSQNPGKIRGDRNAIRGRRSDFLPWFCQLWPQFLPRI